MKDPYGQQCAWTIKALRAKYPYNFYGDPSSFFSDTPLVNLGADFGVVPSLFEPSGIFVLFLFCFVFCVLCFVFCVFFLFLSLFVCFWFCFLELSNYLPLTTCQVSFNKSFLHVGARLSVLKQVA